MSLVAIAMGACIMTPIFSPDLTWMTGTWSANVWGGRMEEHWTSQSGDTLLGLNRVVREGKTVHKEFIWIETIGADTHLTVHVFRQPEETVKYRLTHVGTKEAVFTNPEHKRLQSMTYRRTADELLIILAGVRQDKEFKEEIRLRKV